MERSDTRIPVPSLTYLPHRHARQARQARPPLGWHLKITIF